MESYPTLQWISLIGNDTLKHKFSCFQFNLINSTYNLFSGPNQFLCLLSVYILLRLMGNYHTSSRYHSAKICAKPIPFIFLQPTSKPWIIFPPLWSPFSLSSSCPQFKLKRVLVPTLQPETRRSGFQNTSSPQLTTKSDGEEWPQRPLGKKTKIKESGSL